MNNVFALNMCHSDPVIHEPFKFRLDNKNQTLALFDKVCELFMFCIIKFVTYVCEVLIRINQIFCTSVGHIKLIFTYK